jgi:hypothetical protein
VDYSEIKKSNGFFQTLHLSYSLFCFAPKEYLASYSYYYCLSSIHVYEAQTSDSDVGFEREIKNVHEIWQEITRIIPEHNTTVVRIENLSLKNQLFYISQTNILIGMHSTAMTYIMFLPKQAGVIELFPKDTLTTNKFV